MKIGLQIAKYLEEQRFELFFPINSTLFHPGSRGVHDYICVRTLSPIWKETNVKSPAPFSCHQLSPISTCMRTESIPIINIWMLGLQPQLQSILLLTLFERPNWWCRRLVLNWITPWKKRMTWHHLPSIRWEAKSSHIMVSYILSFVWKVKFTADHLYFWGIGTDGIGTDETLRLREEGKVGDLKLNRHSSKGQSMVMIL